jgi:hypothetical protein
MRNETNRWNRVPVEFRPETWFNVTPQVALRAAQQEKFEQLKEQLLVEKLDELVDPRLNPALRGAANEAAALAWVTRFPLLVFPALFEEKTNEALVRADRQEQITQRSRELLAV